MVSRYYYDGTLQPGNVELSGLQAHHLINVKRARLGERVELFDGRGNAVHAKVVELSRKSVVLQVEHPARSCQQQTTVPEVILASAVPKGDRFRWLIEKATEIGVARFIPLITEHSVVLPRETKLEKHRQYVIEACKQSGRNCLMEISEQLRLPDLCHDFKTKSAQILMGHPHGDISSPYQLQKCMDENVTSLLLIVGPEAGLSDDEIDLLKKHHAIPICCSPNILRTETAGLVLASLAVSSSFKNE